MAFNKYYNHFNLFSTFLIIISLFILSMCTSMASIDGSAGTELARTETGTAIPSWGLFVMEGLSALRRRSGLQLSQCCIVLLARQVGKSAFLTILALAILKEFVTLQKESCGFTGTSFRRSLRLGLRSS